jgi:proline iminopeptidase
LVAHSWGGLLSLCYAAVHPERLAGLVLVGSIGPRKPWEREFWERLERRHTDDQRRRLAEIDGEIAHTRDRARRAELYRLRYNVALPSYFAARCRHLAFEISSFSRLVGVNTMADMHRTRYADQSWERGLSRVTAVVTVIHGREDPVPWSVVEDICRVLPSAAPVGLDECGHFPWLEVPDRFREVLTAALPNG